jgi:hypothetical protein
MPGRFDIRIGRISIKTSYIGTISIIIGFLYIFGGSLG